MDLVSNKEAYRKPQKLPGSPKEPSKTSRAEMLPIFSKLTDLWCMLEKNISVNYFV